MALIEGRLEREGDCLYLRSVADPTLRYAILWSYGTTWRDNPEGVVLPEGHLVELGELVSSGGGYHSAERLATWTSSAVAARANACAEGEFREVAVVQQVVAVQTD